MVRSFGPCRLASLAVLLATTSAYRAPPGAADRTRQTMILSRLGACDASDTALHFDPRTVERHCLELRHVYAEYRTTFVEPASQFFAAHRPASLPKTVVYPFGGGDLATALTTFPDATEITTLSLEPSGDVGLVDRLAPDDIQRELALHRAHVERLYDWGYSRTDNLANAATARLPGEVLFALSALTVLGGAPLGLRYFTIQDDGSLRYTTTEDPSTDGPPPHAFDNVEISFRLASDAPGTTRVFRHVAANLDDDHVRAQPGLLAHLETKGDVSAMTKAASHLLWDPHFSLVREWLARHVVWMASDSTGLPPSVALAHGLVQEPFGTYEGKPWGMEEGSDGASLVRLFAASPHRALGFHYGYPDKGGHAYLIITHRR